MHPVIYLEDPVLHEKAVRLFSGLSAGLHFDFIFGCRPIDQTCLVYGDDGLFLSVAEGKKPIAIQADFIAGGVAHRLNFGGGKSQSIAKAVGLNKRSGLHILDATAGLGRDAFVFASLSAQVTMLERNPQVYALLHDGLCRARIYAEQEGQQDLLAILQRMTLLHANSTDFLKSAPTPFDVIYLDPMFPERKKAALVKKEMRAFHEIVGGDDDADNLLADALAKAIYRVVVKRPRAAGFIADRAPSYQLEGKSSRFDIYTLKAIG